MTVKASRSAGMTVPPLSTPRRPAMWAAGQSERLQRVRLRTLPPSRKLSRSRMAGGEHGWPLSADDWDAQMLFFLHRGYRVIAHDRRGHGRSAQTAEGHDMDHYADDLAALTAHLSLKDAIHVGHSTGGGEVAHYL